MSSNNRPTEQFDSNNSSDEALIRQTPVTRLPCDDVAALIPAYSIGATDPEEAAAVNQHLSACPQATAELAEYGKLAEALLYATPPRQAPAHLVDQLRAATSATRINPLLAPRSAMRAPGVTPRPLSTAPSVPAALTPGTPAANPIGRWSFAKGLVTAAGMLLVVLNLALLIQNQQLRTAQETLAAQLRQQNRALIFLAAEEPQEVVLPAAQENSRAQADVLWNNDLGVAVIYVRAFPELPPDKAYQIWLNKDGQRSSPGLFTVETGGMGIFVFPIQESLDVYDAIGITPEPSSGSPGPTAPPVVRGPV